MSFAFNANRPLVKVGGMTSKLPTQEQRKLQPVGLAVSPTTFRGLPAGGATTEVVAAKQEER